MTPKSLPLIALLVSSALAETAPVPRLPLDVFSHPVPISSALISPDGNAIVYQATGENERAMVVRNLVSRKTYYGTTQSNEIDIHFTWFGPNAVGYINMFGGIDGQTADGGVYRYYNTNDGDQHVQRIVHARTSGYSCVLFTESETHDIRSVELNARYPAQVAYLTNPGHVVGWLADRTGNVRVGLRSEHHVRSVIYRENDQANWRVPRGLEHLDDETIVRDLEGDGKTLYVSQVMPNRKWGLRTYDLAAEAWGPVIASHDHYDIIPRNGIVEFDGLNLQGLVFSQTSHQLLGVRYVTVSPKTLWLDPTLRMVQAAVDHALPGKINTVKNFSDDLQTILILSWAPNDPGVYYLFDLEKKKLTPLFPRMPSVTPAQMAPMYPVTYKARDGVPIEAYLMTPVGVPARNLPLIVYVHGGPFARVQPEFDQITQFLANRGYAVLIMNFRGSTGYGKDFYRLGYGKADHEMQDDIADGARWAITAGVADPHRIAIMGTQFGGYSVLMGLIQHPELYRCGIDAYGITDWVSYLKATSDGTVEDSGLIIDTGDEQKDEAQLQKISPLVSIDKLTAPLLIIHDKENRFVAYKQSSALAEALERNHHPAEIIGARRSFLQLAFFFNFPDLFLRMEQFLDKNLPPDSRGNGTASAAQGQPQS